MIAKIKTGADFSGAFFYNLKKVEEGHASFLYSSGLRGLNNYREIIKYFNDISIKGNISQPVFHTSLNFAPGEIINDVKLENIVNDYMNALGYSKTPFVVFKHEDTHHPHVHIISTNLELVNGKFKKINDSFLHYRSAEITRTLEEKYGLVQALNVKKSKFELELGAQKYGKVDTYAYLSSVVEEVVRNYSFRNLLEMNHILRNFNITCNEMKNFGGYYKFFFENKSCGGTLKQLNTGLRKDDILAKFGEDKQYINSQLDALKKDLMSKYLYISETELQTALNSIGIEKINEVYYLDHLNKRICKNYELKIPKNFVKDFTTPKALFEDVVKLTTQYRKEKRIFHESRFFKSDNNMKEFIEYIISNLDVPRKQSELVAYEYFTYKSRNLDVLLAKEKEKDIKFVNKVIHECNGDMQYLHKHGITFDQKNIFIENNVDGQRSSVLREECSPIIIQHKLDEQFSHEEAQSYKPYEQYSQNIYNSINEITTDDLEKKRKKKKKKKKKGGKSL